MPFNEPLFLISFALFACFLLCAENVFGGEPFRLLQSDVGDRDLETLQHGKVPVLEEIEIWLGLGWGAEYIGGLNKLLHRAGTHP